MKKIALVLAILLVGTLFAAPPKRIVTPCMC